MSLPGNRTHIRFDWAAKQILRSKANFGILEGFLSELFNEDVKIQKILSEEGNANSQVDKTNQVDLLVENSKGELLIVEIQNTKELDYLFRIIFSNSKVITDYMNLGDSYSNVKKVITISIIYFNFGQGEDYLYKGETSFIGVNYKDVFQLSEEQKALFNKNSVEDIFPFHYLIRVNQFDDIAKNTIDEWIYFFKNSEIPDDFKAKGITEAREKLKTLSMSKKELREYDRYLDELSSNASYAETIRFEQEWNARMEGKKEGIEIGVRQGIEKEKKETVLNSHQAGLSVDIISQITNLSIEEIELIIEENSNK